MINDASDGSSHSLKSFLARPAIVAQGDWMTTSSIANTELLSVSLPSGIIKNVPTFSRKIAGFKGFRATTVLTLQVNTNRFQQGRLMMVYFPMAETAKQKHNTMQKSLMMRTQLPRVEFDAATDTQITMKIPFIYDRVAYDCTRNTGDIGHVGLIVYSPLVALTGETSAEYTLWAHFEDVELLFPAISDSTLVPQTGLKGKKKFSPRFRNDPESAETKTEGFISSNLHRISRVADIAGEVPLLSSIAGPVSWIASAAANVASSFGYSKPLSDQPTIKTHQKLFGNAFNSCGTDNSYNLGIFEDSRLTHLPSFAGQDVDELAIAYPISIPTWIKTFSWLDTAGSDTLLLSFYVTPMHYDEVHINPDGTGSMGKVSFTTPMSYIGQHFRFWRGSLKYKIKLVKTEFHSGRLMIVFNPDSSRDVTASNCTYLHKEIVDIRSCTEFEFTIPYVSTIPYKRTEPGVLAMSPYETDYTSYNGQISIFVLNALKAPSTVSPSITCLVEQCADADFEFACPIGKYHGSSGPVPILFGSKTLYPQSWGTLKPKKKYINKNTKTLVADLENQGEASDEHKDDKLTQEIQSKPIGSSHVVTNNLAAAQYCIGEKIKSLRQLMQKSTPFIKSFHNNAVFFHTRVNPFANSIPVMDPSTAFGTFPMRYGFSWSQAVTSFAAGDIACYVDNVSYFTMCYAFARGGMRLKVYNDAEQLFRVSLGMSNDGSWLKTNYGADYGFTDINIFNQTMIPHTSTNPTSEVQVPYYNNSFMHCVANATGYPANQHDFAQAKFDYRETNPETQFVISTTNKATIFFVQRSIGEDFSAGFWTGSLPLALTGNLVDTRSCGYQPACFQ